MHMVTICLALSKKRYKIYRNVSQMTKSNKTQNKKPPWGGFLCIQVFILEEVPWVVCFVKNVAQFYNDPTVEDVQ